MDRPAWLADGWPELRTAPPWVMAEMVAAQPGLVAPILGLPAVADVARLVLEAAARGEPVVVAGCGTSEHGAQAIARLLAAGLRPVGHRVPSVAARQSLDAALAPDDGGLFVAVTHDGGTRATLLAAEAARAAGARVALVTANPAGPIAALADAVVVTPLHDDSWCHTVAYSSAVLAGGALAAAVSGADLEPGPLRDYLARALADDGQADAVAEALWTKAPLVVAGVGADEITAREFALKVEEGPRVPSVARHPETLLHGHLAACDAGTGVVLLGIEPLGTRRDARLELAALAAAAVGATPAAVLAADAPLPAAATPGGRLVLPPAPACPFPALPALLGGAAALQRLTLALVARAGVNPDLIRREEEPYRTAAVIGDESADW